MYGDWEKELAEEQELSSRGRSDASGDTNAINKFYADAIKYGYEQADSESTSLRQFVSRYNAIAAKNTAEGAKLQYAGQVTANSWDRLARATRRVYEERSRVHQIERREISRYIVELKISEFRKPGGAINYNESMREIGARALSDLANRWTTVAPSQVQLLNPKIPGAAAGDYHILGAIKNNATVPISAVELSAALYDCPSHTSPQAECSLIGKSSALYESKEYVVYRAIHDGIYISGADEERLTEEERKDLILRKCRPSALVG